MANDQAGPPAHQPESGTRREKPDSILAIVIWGRVIMGLALATIGGVAFGHAWTSDYLPWWLVGAISLLTGILLILSAIYARGGAKKLPDTLAVPGSDPDDRDPLVPLLGALLVYKYQYISQEQLNTALEQQRRLRTTRHRLGEILLEMGIITRSQLLEALAYQRSQSSRKRSHTLPSDSAAAP